MTMLQVEHKPLHEHVTFRRCGWQGGAQGKALFPFSASTLDEGADLVRRCKEDQCPVAYRPGWQDHGLAAERPGVARIDPEAEIGLQEFGASAVGSCFGL